MLLPAVRRKGGTSDARVEKVSPATLSMLDELGMKIVEAAEAAPVRGD